MVDLVHAKNDSGDMMNNGLNRSEALTNGLAFWCRIWQQQLDQTMAFWGLWAQMLPHDTAKQLSREAEAMKPAATKAKTSQKRRASSTR